MKRLGCKDSVKVFVLLFMMLSVLSAKADDTSVDYDYQNVVKRLAPLSPQASMMQRFGNYPVDYSTGVPHISVPLYTIKVGDFELPISIDYHNSGIRVQDMATQVGLGWVLNAGGCISVEVKGGSDADKNEKQWADRKEMEDAAGYNDESDKWDGIVSGIDGDVESDRYNYNFCGHSGTFRKMWRSVNKEPEFVSLPYSDMKIEAESDKDSKLLIPKLSNCSYTPFILTDTKGIRYYFDYPEISGGGEIGGYYFLNSITCYLTKIEFPNKRDSIVFHYSDASFYETYSPNESYSIAYGTYTSKPDITYYNPNNPYEQKYVVVYKDYDYMSNESTNIHHVSEVKLDKIEWNGNSIDFTYNEDRKEYRTASIGLRLKRLTDMSVKNSDGDIVKKIVFDNDYYQGSWEGDYRMFLRSVSICNNEDVKQETYSFKYNQTKLPPYFGIPFPYTSATPKADRYCHEDFWGYALGYFCNSTWIPKFPNDRGPYNSRSFADRQANGGALAGSLVSVTYPTGGSTSYEMECNRLKNDEFWGGLRVKSITDYDNSGEILRTRNFKYSNACPSFSWSEMESFYRYQVCDAYVIPSYNNATLGPFVDVEIGSTRDIYSCSPCVPLTSYYGSPIVYGNVVEYFGTESQNKGFIIRNYTEERTSDMNKFGYEDYGDFIINNGPFYSQYSQPQFYSVWSAFDFGNRRMMLGSETRYDSEGHCIYYLDNSFDEIYLDTVNVGIKVIPFYSWHNLVDGGSRSYFEDYEPHQKAVQSYIDNNFMFRNVWAIPSYKRLASTTEYRDGVTTKTTYGYDEDKRTLSPKSKSVSIANNNLAQACSSSTTTYTYPFESLSVIAKDMTRKNMLVPLKTTTTRNGTVMRTDSVAYGFVAGGIQQKEYYTSLGTDTLEKRLTYSYDSKGRVQSLTTDAGDCTVFVWGNRNDWPIAKIEGKTLQEIKNIIGAGMYQNIFYDNPSETMLFAAKDLLQKKNCSVIVYDHETLVGVKSVIHPNYNAEYFDYDSMGRLIRRKENKAIREEYQYNYRK